MLLLLRALGIGADTSDCSNYTTLIHDAVARFVGRRASVRQALVPLFRYGLL